MTRLLSSTSRRCLKHLAESSSSSRAASTGAMASVSHLVASSTGGRGGEPRPQHAMTRPGANGGVPPKQRLAINNNNDYSRQDKFLRQRDEYSTVMGASTVEAALEQVLESQRTQLGYGDDSFEDVVRSLVKVGYSHDE